MHHFYKMLVKENLPDCKTTFYGVDKDELKTRTRKSSYSSQETDCDDPTPASIPQFGE